MWDNNRYESPSALHMNLVVMRRRSANAGRNAGKFPKMLAILDRAEDLRFEVLYGFNPRCCFQGTWGKPGRGYGITWGVRK